MAYRLEQAREARDDLKTCKQCGSSHLAVAAIRRRPTYDQIVGSATGWFSIRCETCGADAGDE